MRLGMVPGGSPAFLLPDGTVRGRTSAALSEGAPLSTSAEPSLLSATGHTAPSAPPRPQAPPVAPPAVRPPVPAAAGRAGPGQRGAADPAPSPRRRRPPLSPWSRPAATPPRTRARRGGRPLPDDLRQVIAA